MPAGRRTVAALGVGIFAMPLALPLPTGGAKPAPRVVVQAAPVRTALVAAGGFDRPSSGAVDGAQIAALAQRQVVRASRDSVRVVPVARSLTRPTTARPAAKKPKVATKPKSTWGEKWVRPGNGRFTSGFKQRWGRMHRGVDLAAPTGSPIYAAGDGVVTFAGSAGGYGRLVLIRHGKGVVTAYGHMSKIKTHVGERVKAGEIIALVGSEGRSTGPHLHFEVRINGVHVNPQPFMSKRKVWL